MIPASWEIEYGEFFSASAADQLRKTKEMYEESRMNQQIEDNEEYLVGILGSGGPLIIAVSQLQQNSKHPSLCILLLYSFLFPTKTKNQKITQKFKIYALQKDDIGDLKELS